MKEKKVIVSLKGISKTYDNDVKVVKNIDLDIYEGEFLTILGASGCGKTTTLRMIAGFEDVSSGDICIDGSSVIGVPPYKRQVNTAFQSYALFPHLSVYDNIAYGLKVKKVSKAEIHERVSHMKTMQKKLGITFIYITHDQEEALTMSDRIAVMHKGILEQVCSPKELYMKPKTKYVAEFIGESNIFEGVVKDRNSDNCTVAIESGNILCSGDGYVAGQMVYVCIRPEKVRITRKAGSGNSLPAEIKEQIFTGNMMKHIAVLSNGHEIKVADIASYNDINIGDKVYLEWDAKDAVMIKNPTGPMAENFDTLRGVQ